MNPQIQNLLTRMEKHEQEGALIREQLEAASRPPSKPDQKDILEENGRLWAELQVPISRAQAAGISFSMFVPSAEHDIIADNEALRTLTDFLEKKLATGVSQSAQNIVVLPGDVNASEAVHAPVAPSVASRLTGYSAACGAAGPGEINELPASAGPARNWEYVSRPEDRFKPSGQAEEQPTRAAAAPSRPAAIQRNYTAECEARQTSKPGEQKLSREQVEKMNWTELCEAARTGATYRERPSGKEGVQQ